MILTTHKTCKHVWQTTTTHSCAFSSTIIIKHLRHSHIYSLSGMLILLGTLKWGRKYLCSHLFYAEISSDSFQPLIPKRCAIVWFLLCAEHLCWQSLKAEMKYFKCTTSVVFVQKSKTPQVLEIVLGKMLRTPNIKHSYFLSGF